VEEPVNGGELQDPGSLSDPGPAPQPATLPAWQPALHRERTRRRALLRRLAALLGTGTLAFTFTTWLLLRRESRSPRPASSAPAPKSGAAPDASAPPGDEAAGASALKTARAMLAALNQDDLETAYSLFSPRYRAQVPLTAFRRLVKTHRDMFHTEEQNVNTRSETRDRVMLEIRVSADDDEDYVAQFTLLRIKGRWFVDELHWSFEEDDSHSSA